MVHMVKDRQYSAHTVQAPLIDAGTSIELGLWHSNTDKIGKLKYMVKLESDIQDTSINCASSVYTYIGARSLNRHNNIILLSSIVHDLFYARFEFWIFELNILKQSS